MGRYRLRTWTRTHTPWWLLDHATWFLAKGKKDCGDHEWYRSEGDTWRCYHCEPGQTTSGPAPGHWPELPR